MLKQKPGFVSASANEGASKVREKAQKILTPEERRAAAEEVGMGSIRPFQINIPVHPNRRRLDCGQNSRLAGKARWVR